MLNHTWSERLANETRGTRPLFEIRLRRCRTNATVPDFDNASPYSILSIANASSSGLMASCCGVVNRVSV